MSWLTQLLLVGTVFLSVKCAPNNPSDLKATPYEYPAKTSAPYVMTDDEYHPRKSEFNGPPVGPLHEHSREYWQRTGQDILRTQLKKDRVNKNVAKNIIMFIGDGMSIPTQMATRVHMGGENVELSFEKFPYSGLTKTYCVNFQVPDSACTATAFLTGVKTNAAVLGVSAAVRDTDCAAAANEANQVNTIFKWAQDAGMSTGLVTTTRVTHATAAAVYAKTAGRTFERDNNTPPGCVQISHQLVHGEVGSRLNVVLGGGTREFLPTTVVDSRGDTGLRTDGRNLINEWLAERGRSGRAAYVDNKQNLLNANTNALDYLMGLFHSDHMEYFLQSNPLTDPTLNEMTSVAVEMLRRNPKGYLLLVEGGRIDHGHHATWARMAIEETVQFEETIAHIASAVDEEDTLVLVAADHSHTMSIGSYSDRGANIFGTGDESPLDNLPFFILSYAQGQGYFMHSNETGGRVDPTDMNFNDPQFTYPSTVPLATQTHGGDDVGVYATGPWAHLFTGVYEQHFIPHALMYAACIGPREFQKADICDGYRRGDGVQIVSNGIILIALAALILTRHFTM